MRRFFKAHLLLCCGLVVSVASQSQAAIPLGVTIAGEKENSVLPRDLALALPGEYAMTLHAPHATNWLHAKTLSVTLAWPDGMPGRLGGLVWLKDRNAFWHQRLIRDVSVARDSGKDQEGTRDVQGVGNAAGVMTNGWRIPFHPHANGWQTPGHALAWHHRVRIDPQSVGVRLFGDAAFTGRCVLVSISLEPQASPVAPQISKVRALTRAPRAYGCYEARFDLPDRYDNPFDPSQIDAGAQIITPAGQTNTIHAFYYQPHYRIEDELGEPVEPDGRPEWRIRYCPREPGVYRVTLYARDGSGAAVLPGALSFTAAPATADALRFVRVSEKDPRFFEHDDGTLFYPIGHNVRSATDARMDDKFPWIFRQEESSVAYRRYFARMQAAGENIAEVWMSAWSLGLEWTEGIGGYHGANDYHMGHAWELDRVIDLAMRHRIYINLVFNYHGRISTWCDPEWHLHPYNKATPGGWLTQPLAFFTDARAVEMQRRFCRYTQARWGWAPVIFGYELCSELNLTGHETHHKTHFDPAVVAWCKTLGGYVKAIDPYGHLVSVHVSNDYTFLNPAICTLPEMDFNPLDAYHHGQPERIIPLVIGTAKAGAVYGKPILITEFGGSPMAAGREHLMIEQHAALWAGACTPLAGIPMFWWWQVVDENDLYGRYTGIKRFMEGVDPRDPSAQQATIELVAGEKGDATLLKAFRALGTVAQDTLRGYVYPARFARSGQTPRKIEHACAIVNGLTPGLFRVEVFDTGRGVAIRRFDVRAPAGNLEIPLPHGMGDCAFKARWLTSLTPKAGTER